MTVATVNIAGLPVATSASSSDVTVIVQNGVTKQASIALIGSSTSAAAALSFTAPLQRSGNTVLLGGWDGTVDNGVMYRKTSAEVGVTAGGTVGQLLLGQGAASAPGWLAAGVSGQVLVGVTGAAPMWTATIPDSAGVTSFSAGTTGFTPASASMGAVILDGILATDHGGTGAANAQGAAVNLTTDYVVPTLAALTALLAPYPSAATNECRVTSDDQGGGTWVFETGDQSANVALDTGKAIWAAPDSDPTGASGAWHRQFSGAVDRRWAGAKADGTTDNATALANVCRLGLPVTGGGIGAGVYAFNGPITLLSSAAATLEIIDAHDKWLNPNASAGYRLIAPTAALATGTISGTLFTASSVSSGGLAVGQRLIGTLIEADTNILSQVSGAAGGAGVYVVSRSQFVTAATSVSTVVPLAGPKLRRLKFDRNGLPTDGATGNAAYYFYGVDDVLFEDVEGFGDAKGRFINVENGLNLKVVRPNIHDMAWAAAANPLTEQIWGALLISCRDFEIDSHIIKNLEGMVISAVVTASISANIMTVASVSSGTLAPDQRLFSNTVGQIAAKTTIVNQLTGTPGGAGTYTVNLSQNISSTVVNAGTIQTGPTASYQNTDGISTGGCSEGVVTKGNTDNVGEGIDITGTTPNRGIILTSNEYDHIAAYAEKFVHGAYDCITDGAIIRNAGYAGITIAGGPTLAPRNISVINAQIYDTGSANTWQSTVNVGGVVCLGGAGDAITNVQIINLRAHSTTQEYGIYNSGIAATELTVINDSITGAISAAYVGVTKNHVYSTAAGRTAVDGGLTITTDGLQVTAGGVTVTAGNTLLPASATLTWSGQLIATPGSGVLTFTDSAATSGVRFDFTSDNVFRVLNRVGGANNSTIRSAFGMFETRLRVGSNVSAANAVDINGSLGRGIPVVKTADFTLAATENWLIHNKTTACVATLPAASAWPGREVMFQSYQSSPLNSASANVVPIGGGAATNSILSAAAGRWATLVSDGVSSWLITRSG